MSSWFCDRRRQTQKDMTTPTTSTAALHDLPLEVRLNRLEALVDASESINRATGLDQILQSILDLLATQLNCERATVFLHDKRTNKLHARQMRGSKHFEILLERGVGIAGYVAEQGVSILLNDVQNDPRFDRSTDKRTGYLTKTMLCVPLRNPEGKLLGSLQAINNRAGEFTEADLAYLESFAVMAAIAVGREQLAQEALRSNLISTELELARKIQQRLLPATGKINLPAPYCAWGISQPCYDVGGDAFDALALPTGECAFWVADVSGKGIGAALLMTTLQIEMRELIRDRRDLAQVAGELNTKVNSVAPLGTYATLFVGVLDAQTERLRYVNAGHLPPLRIGGNGGGVAAREFDVGGFPIGLLPGSAYEVGETAFRRGSRLAVFSDGVTDSENCAGQTFEDEDMAARLATLDAHDLDQLGLAFFADLDRFRIGVPAKDDTTFLLIGLD
ncbi:MAG: SpoIIE family protein phosphatase [Pyrinomonadaceae bacterium]|nr:SpoIIE family protein phosphatase [Pyrinomonadaceae bacterium]